MDIIEILSRPWPWWISGPLLGLMVPVLLLAGNKEFGISSTFRHLCAMVSSRPAYFDYDWKKQGGWQLALALGVVAGGWLAATFFDGGRMPGLTVEARRLFQSWGVALDSSGYSLISWRAGLTP
jgi:hypothetical protein